MTTSVLPDATGVHELLLGDEAVALAARDAGIRAAYAYPGTPSTEILETLLGLVGPHGDPAVHWCANEKTAYEAALGVSLVGGRALVAMKHVGLNVAADPFVNSALLGLAGGIVLAVADDPGMHSSQNEQDSRVLADFARIVCLEPATPQEAYTMTREAFALSEQFQVPVMLRLVTRLCHGRAMVRTTAPETAPPCEPVRDPNRWILLPAIARRRYRALLDRQPAFRAFTESSTHNPLHLVDDDHGLGVVTAGRARNEFLEVAAELGFTPSHLHLGAYPLPIERLRRLAAHVQRLVVLEEGQPFVERTLRGVLPTSLVVLGRESSPEHAAVLPPDGELTPEAVRRALGVETPPPLRVPGAPVPARPPQLCNGCPHRDAFAAIAEARIAEPTLLVTGDIGCYTLGAAPPHRAIESCVCMGASIGMAKGAADAGHRPVLAVIGDSTFLHSGVTPLMDAVAGNTPLVVMILDNEAVAMTGAQPPVLTGSRLAPIVAGVGVPAAHLHVVEAHPKAREALAELLIGALRHDGVSVIIVHRMCLEAVRRLKETARTDHDHERGATT